MADDTADGGATQGAERTATGQHCTADSAHASTDGGVLPLARHAGTTTQAQQHGYADCAECQSLHCFHGVTFFLIRVFRVSRRSTGVADALAGLSGTACGPRLTLTPFRVWAVPCRQEPPHALLVASTMRPSGRYGSLQRVQRYWRQ